MTSVARASAAAIALLGAVIANAAERPTTPTANRAPTISGTIGNATVGTDYFFRPTASDPDGDALTFSISGAPSWMIFRALDGRIVGRPTAAATHANIVISVRDVAGNEASLPPATVTVAGPPGRAPTITGSATGSARVSWTPPTLNADGSMLANLAGYRIVYGISAAALTQTVQLSDPGLTSYTIGNLSPGTYYFAVRAYTSSGTESANSKVVRKRVR